MKQQLLSRIRTRIALWVAGMMALILATKMATAQAPFARRGLTQVVLTIVVLAIVIPIGAVVIAMFQDAVPYSSISGAGETAVNATFTSIWASWPLLNVIFIVVIAGAIIGVIIAAFLVKGRV